MLQGAWRFRTLCGLLFVLVFPRLTAMILTAFIRLVARAILALTDRLVREVLGQAALLTSELETQIIDWMQSAWDVQGQPAPSPPLPPLGGPPPQQQLVVAPHPTRPLDYLTLAFVALPVLRNPQGWVGLRAG